MNMTTPVRPMIFCFPIGVSMDNQQVDSGGDDADPKWL